MSVKIWNDYGRFHLTALGGGSASAVKVLDRGRAVSLQEYCSQINYHSANGHWTIFINIFSSIGKETWVTMESILYAMYMVDDWMHSMTSTLWSIMLLLWFPWVVNN